MAPVPLDKGHERSIAETNLQRNYLHNNEKYSYFFMTSERMRGPSEENTVVDLPQRARVVIVGGGIVGCSVAYHLTLRGCTDVVLLERRQLTSGTTWHAAGLVGQLRATYNLTRLAQYTTELYETLEGETGQATGFRQIGSLSVATNKERFEELRRGASMARCFGLDVNVLTPDEASELW